MMGRPPPKKGTQLSKETQAMLDKMMKDSKLTQRQMQEIKSGVAAGGSLPTGPSELRSGGDRRDVLAARMHNLQDDWAGRAKFGGNINRYTSARGSYTDLDEFTDWRHVQLPPQRKSKAAVMAAQDCHPSGRPIRDAYRPMPSLRPSGEHAKLKLQQAMMAGGGADAAGSMLRHMVVQRERPSPVPVAPPRDSMDDFVGIMSEVQERQEWLKEMKKLGAIDGNGVASVQAEISQRLAMAKKLDTKLDNDERR